MIHYIFNACVVFLTRLAQLFGVSYEAINVILFCGIGPVLFFLVVLGLWTRIKFYQSKMHYFRDQWTRTLDSLKEELSKTNNPESDRFQTKY